MILGIIIQARMGSTRLPGKILKPIGGKKLIEHILYRLTFLRHEATIVIATTNNKQDNVLQNFCITNSVNCFRGSEFDVLERYYICAKEFNFSNIIRLTADNPFTDIEELDRLIDLHFSSHSDFSKSFSELPVGVGAEIFTINALEKSYYEGHLAHHREHVDEYILEHPEIFKIATLSTSFEKNKPNVRLTVDTIDDLGKACFIVNNACSEYVTTEEAIGLCLQFA